MLKSGSFWSVTVLLKISLSFIHWWILVFMSWLFIVNNTAEDRGVQIFLQDSDLISFMYTPRSGITVLYSSSILSFFRKQLSIFYHDCRNLHSLQYCSALGFCFFHIFAWTCYFSLIIALLTDVRWPNYWSWLLGKDLGAGKIEGRMRRGWQRMRWMDEEMDGNRGWNSVNMSLSKFQEIVKDREAGHVAVHGAAKT